MQSLLVLTPMWLFTTDERSTHTATGIAHDDRRVILSSQSPAVYMQHAHGPHFGDDPERRVYVQVDLVCAVRVDDDAAHRSMLGEDDYVQLNL